MPATTKAVSFFELSETVAAAPPELTADRPSATVEVTATARALAPNGQSTTYSSVVRVQGTVQDGATADVDAAGGIIPSGITISAKTDASPLAGEAVALTSFDLTRAMRFDGNCAAPGDQASPCRGTVQLQFDRSDAGRNGGSVRIDCGLIFSTRIVKSDAPDEELPLPWAFEVMLQ